MSQLPTATIIGAGSSGIAAAKALHERGIPCACFEASDRVVGNRVVERANGVSAAYRDLHINTSRDRVQFSDFPMARSCPHFPHHTDIANGHHRDARWPEPAFPGGDEFCGLQLHAHDYRDRKRYVASKRHTIQVDSDRYLHELERERRRGEARARAEHFALPVRAHAGGAGHGRPLAA
jgi:cation diffusion facilitator CzcD-associated flavoprotein CzcO